MCPADGFVLALIAGRGNSAILGLACLGLLVWELLWQSNARRWPVWCLMPAGMIWIYGGIMAWSGRNLLRQPGDPSWWVLLDFVFCPLCLVVYAVFRTQERMAGR